MREMKRGSRMWLHLFK